MTPDPDTLETIRARAVYADLLKRRPVVVKRKARKGSETMRSQIHGQSEDGKSKKGKRKV
jgi:hypothetical protein